MTQAKRALQADNLSVVLGGQRVLQEASATFHGDGRHAVIGRSGAGKSVFMKACCGLLPLQAGQISYDQISCNKTSEAAFAKLRQRVAFVHQDPALLDDLSVGENIRFVAERRLASGAEAEARKWIDTLALNKVEHLRPPALSPGLLRQVALARALCTRPEFLILDEPTTGLDPRAARDVDAALASLDAAGSTLIVITHDLRSLETLQPNLCWVDAGTVRWQGCYQDRFGVDEALDALLTGQPFPSLRPVAA